MALSLIAGCGGGDADRAGAATTPTASSAGQSPTGAGAAAGSDPATPGASSSSSRDGDGPLRYAVLGDSYSNGQSVSPSAAWPVVMARQLDDDGLAVEIVANPSVTGATTAQMLTTGLPPIRAARPDVMTVMLGVNDQVQGRTIKQFAADEDRALREAIAITGSADRVLAVDIPDYSVTPMGARFGAPAQIAGDIDAFNAVVRQVAARRKVEFVSIVDISRRLGSGGISSDGLHPSEAQLAAWAERIAPVARREWRDIEPAGR
ncbi:MAG: SGNH/GDSL hydrolase family protein [Solirubrobacteraceae bacterium]|nr:SGNH/GDSL hydrolase family protein [Solirubrobacteraceae bacterium]